MTPNLFDSQRKSILSVALAVLVVVSAGAAVAFTASAAGSTTVSLAPSEQQVDTGGTTTYDVIVENTDNGIGTTDANVTVEDPSIGTITDVSIAGDPANQNVSIASDGSSASFNAIYFGNALSDDPDGVTIATVTVEGTATGASDLSLDVTEISDSTGEVYDVAGAEGASLVVGEGATTTETTTTQTVTPTATQTTTEATTTATQTETVTTTPSETTTETTDTTETTTPTATQTATAIETTATETETTATATETTATATETATQTETATTTPSETTTETTTDTTTPTQTTTTGGDSGGGAGGGNDGAGRTLDEGAIADSLADSGLDDTRVEGVGAALGASDLTDEEITAITDAFAGDDLTDEQRGAVADAIATGDLTDEELRALAGALDDGRLTDAERDALGFLGQPGVAYYQIDFVQGEPIENLDWPDGTYTNDQLIRFAHGSTDEAITRRSAGEFTTDDALAERIDSQNIEIANGTATITFTVADGESVTLSLASYTKPDPTWDPADEDDQVFVDAQTATYESGTHTLTVDLPADDDTDGNDTE